MLRIKSHKESGTTIPGSLQPVDNGIKTWHFQISSNGIPRQNLL